MVLSALPLRCQAMADASMSDDDLLAVLHGAADAVRQALDVLDDWGLAGTTSGQYHSDVAADEACLAVLDRAGLGWLSEESGVAHGDREVIVIVDPVDGSTNASRGLPWYATSLCATDADGARAALVVNQADGRRYQAVRGGGSSVDGRALEPASTSRLSEAIIGLSGYPKSYLGWYQFRALGAVALDLCAVAEGVLDGYLDASPSAHGSWDYAAGMLICVEAGVSVVDAFDRDMLVIDHQARRTPIAASTPELLAEMVEARRGLCWPDDPGI